MLALKTAMALAFKNKVSEVVYLFYLIFFVFLFLPCSSFAHSLSLSHSHTHTRTLSLSTHTLSHTNIHASSLTHILSLSSSHSRNPSSPLPSQNYINAAGFSRRLLELPDMNSERNAESRSKVRTCSSHCCGFNFTYKSVACLSVCISGWLTLILPSVTHISFSLPLPFSVTSSSSLLLLLLLHVFILMFVPSSYFLCFFFLFPGSEGSTEEWTTRAKWIHYWLRWNESIQVLNCKVYWCILLCCNVMYYTVV